jgi:hypothetical protein
MANVDRTRKLLVRTALVTSSTIATLVGAQNLALLDVRQIALVPELPAEATDIPIVEAVPTGPPATPTIEIAHAAPSITILRRAGQSGSIQSAAIQPSAIQPPNPVQVAPPQPVVVQGEAPPPIIVQQASAPSSSGGSQTRSSR